MATFRFSFFLPKPTPYRPFHHRGRLTPLPIKAYKVTVEHDIRVTYLEVEPDETILSKALDSCLSAAPHDCKLGVCMTCPAKVISGVVDKSEGMLSDDVIEWGHSSTVPSGPFPKRNCSRSSLPQ